MYTSNAKGLCASNLHYISYRFVVQSSYHVSLRNLCVVNHFEHMDPDEAWRNLYPMQSHLQTLSLARRASTQRIYKTLYIFHKSGKNSPNLIIYFLTKFVAPFLLLYQQWPNHHISKFNNAVNKALRGVQDGNAQTRRW